MCAKKDFNLPKHPEIEASNLEVIKLMTSLTSRDLVSSRFAWNHYYWFLTDEGIEYLREYLHLPADMVPNTLKKAAATRPPAPPGRGDRGDRPEGDRPGAAARRAYAGCSWQRGTLSRPSPPEESHARTTA